MKPTQQEIIELAREAGIVFDERAMPYYERLVHLALERFGAGGGEPVAFMVETESAAMTWPAKDYDEALTYCAFGELPIKLYTHPSPTDLRAERELRRMLCIMYAGGHAYMDDGEAQDNRANPPIDFMRDSHEVIQQKIQQRSLYASPEKGKQ